jgi:hypothetical protein
VKLEELNALRTRPDSVWMTIEHLRPFATIELDQFPVRFRNDKRECTAVFRHIEGVICDAWVMFDDGDIEEVWSSWTPKVWQAIRTTQPGDQDIKLFRWKGWTRVV